MDVPSIYEVPLVLEERGVGDLVIAKLGLDAREADLADWSDIVRRMKEARDSVVIGLVGKYVESKDAYLSICEALKHSAASLGVQVVIRPIEAGMLRETNAADVLSGIDGVLVPGGFGHRGIEGKIEAVRYARERGVPFLGICLGMQVAVIEFARNVLGFSDAHSTEFNPDTTHPVIDLLPSQRGMRNKGGTMRLGNYRCLLERSSQSFALYGQEEIWERHRHRYELNEYFVDQLERKGMVMAGFNPEYQVVEIVELREHPFFVGVQFHPEFKSRPNRPHPLFLGFLKASYDFRQRRGRA
jgi:CTP synthase